MDDWPPGPHGPAAYLPLGGPPPPGPPGFPPPMPGFFGPGPAP
jgi:hypothetical protein